jgi:hypothetical protein
MEIEFPFTMEINGAQIGTASVKATKVTFTENEFTFAISKAASVTVPYTTIKLVSV